MAVSVTGVLCLLSGLTWDAVLHARRPDLAATEGIFTLANPAHLLMGLGMGATVAGIVGVALQSMAARGGGRWSSPGARVAVLALATVLVVASAVTTSWASISARHASHDDGGSGVTRRHAGAVAHDVRPGATAGHADTVAHPVVTRSGDHDGAGGAAAHRLPSRSHDAHPTPGRAGAPSASAAPRPVWTAVRSGAGGAGTVRTMRYGPMVLAPAVAGRATKFTAVVPGAPMPCSGCYMTSASVDLVYEDGTSANLDTGPMLHHLVLFHSGRRDTTCGPETALGALGQRFFAAGNERTAGMLPAGFGYHLGPEPVTALIELMNHSDSVRTVYLSATVTSVPDSAGDVKVVTPVWLDQDNCSDSEYHVPAGRSNRAAAWTSTITGRVLTVGGHVHDGGIKTVLRNRTTGQHLCTSHARYGRNPAYRGSLESMTTCAWDRLGTVRTGEVLAIDTYYDSARAQDDAMGIMLAYVHETTDLAGGSPPPSDTAPPETSGPPAGRGHHH